MTVVTAPPISIVRATPGARLGAHLIDVVLQIVVFVIPIAGIFIAIAYGLMKDTLPFLDGQSIGKRAMGIRVIKNASGQKLTGDYGAGIVRQISLYIPLFGILDAFM